MPTRIDIRILVIFALAFAEKFFVLTFAPVQNYAIGTGLYNRIISVDSTVLAEEESPQERIERWARNHPFPAFVSPSVCVQVRPPEKGGAGLFASNDIAMNETLTVLPLDNYQSTEDNITAAGFKVDALTLATEILPAGPVKRRVLELIEDGGKGRLMFALAGTIAHLHLKRLKDERDGDGKERKEQKEVEINPFDPFLDVLPLLPSLPSGPPGTRNCDDHPFPSHVLYWSDSEISNYLCSTLALTKARYVRAQAGEAVGLLSTAFMIEHCPHADTQEILEAKNAIVSAIACVQSRTFEGFNTSVDVGAAESNGQRSCGSIMIPFLDLLNHQEAPHNNARHAIDDNRNAAILLSNRFIARGEEIFINYGKREAWDWFSKYGFVPDDVKENHDAVTVALPLFPPLILDRKGTEMNLSSIGKEGAEAANALRYAMRTFGNSQAGDLPMLAEIFLPDVNSQLSSKSTTRPATQPCVVFTFDTEKDSRIIKSQIFPIFCAAERIIRTLYEGQSIDNDVVFSAMIGLSGAGEESSDNDVCRYVEGMARNRLNMLQLGRDYAFSRERTLESMEREKYEVVRLAIANDVRRAEILAVKAFVKVWGGS